MIRDLIKYWIHPVHTNGRARLLVLVAMVLATARMLESAPLQSANDRSRWATVYALVEFGTYQIDEVIRRYPAWDTIDKVRHEKRKQVDGKEVMEYHFYSSKPPLYSTLVAGGYWVLKNIFGLRMDPGNPDSVARVAHILLFLFNIVPTALALSSLTALIWKHGEIGFTRNYVLTAACFATLWSAYLPALNNHTPAVCCVIFALRCAVVTLPINLTTKRLALAGFFSALAVTFELPALAFCAGLFVVLIKFSPWRTIIGFIPAAAIPLGALVLNNYIATGTVKPVYASFSDDTSEFKYKYVENGVPSYWMNRKGVDRSEDQFYPYLFHCTVGHHGLLSLTPIFLLSIFGLLRIEKWKYSPLAVYYLLGFLLTIIVLGFYLVQTDSRNYGGVSVGLRWMLWLIPFWLLMMMPAVDLISGNRLGQTLLIVLMAPSIFSAWYPYESPWKQPWIFQVLQKAGRLSQYNDPPLAYAARRCSWLSQAPVEGPLQPDYWVELSGTGIDGSAITLRIADGGPVDVENHRARAIQFHWNEGRANASLKTVVVDLDQLDGEGDAAGSLLLWPAGKPFSGELLALEDLVYGLPTKPKYTLRARRYAFYPLRTDAFECEVGTAFDSRLSTAPGIPEVSLRSEIWNSAELPFGVAAWDLQTSHDGVLLAKRSLTVVRAGKILPKPSPAE